MEGEKRKEINWELERQADEFKKKLLDVKEEGRLRREELELRLDALSKSDNSSKTKEVENKMAKLSNDNKALSEQLENCQKQLVGLEETKTKMQQLTQSQSEAFNSKSEGLERNLKDGRVGAKLDNRSKMKTIKTYSSHQKTKKLETQIAILLNKNEALSLKMESCKSELEEMKNEEMKEIEDKKIVVEEKRKFLKRKMSRTTGSSWDSTKIVANNYSFSDIEQVVCDNMNMFSEIGAKIRKEVDLSQENIRVERENKRYKEMEERRDEEDLHRKELMNEKKEIEKEKVAKKKMKEKEEKKLERERKKEIVLETETMAAESDDDIFSQTPDRPSTEASQQPQSSPEKKKMSNDVLDTSQWKFVFSGLSAENMKIAQQFIDDLGCQGISNSVNSSVTHVVVKTEENLKAQRTLKFLQAVSSGIKIVSFLWVEACLKDMNNLYKEDNWEALDEELNGANGPYRARKGRQEGKKQLLSGFEVLIDGPIEGLNKPDIEDLLFRAGARTVSSVNMFSFTAGITRLVLVNSVIEYGQEEVTKMLRSFRLAVVDKDWLFDTVSSHSRRPLQGYTLDIVKKVDLMRAGYSGMLTESD